MKRIGLTLSAVLALAACLPSPAMAINTLQLYVQGGAYDTGSETWVVNASGSPLNVWVIGNVNGSGGQGSITDVNLVVSYLTSAAPVSLQLTSGKTGGYGGYTDPSTPSAAVFVQTKTDGSTPSGLSSHSVFGAGTSWTQYGLGDFTLQDSQIQDFTGSNGDPLPPAAGGVVGQINVYSIQLLSAATGPVSLHFDAFGTDSKGKPDFAPYSHDATANGLTTAPEPATISLLLSACVPLGVVGLRRLRRRGRPIPA